MACSKMSHHIPQKSGIYCFQSHTGSGKTSILPVELASNGSKVIVALPTTKHVKSIQKYVASKTKHMQQNSYYDVSWGDAPSRSAKQFSTGYILGCRESHNPNANLLYVTVGWLYNKMLHNQIKCDYILVDEVHSIQKEYTGLIHLINCLFKTSLEQTCLSGLEQTRQTIIYLSATFDETILSSIKYDHFINLSRDKTNFPIRRRFSQCYYSLGSLCNSDITPQLEHIAQMLVLDYNAYNAGHSPHKCIMCFLPGKHDMNTVSYLFRRNARRCDTRFVILELSGLNRHFTVQDIRDENFTIILSTEIGRTGFTIAQVSKIYDSCIVKQEVCRDFDTLILQPVIISCDEREQSEGRLGRVRKNILEEYVYVCSAAEFEQFKSSKNLETLVGDNLNTFLQLSHRGVPHTEMAPTFGSVERLNEKLEFITATENGKITEYGQLIDILGAHYLLVRMLYIAQNAPMPSTIDSGVILRSNEQTKFTILLEIVFLSMWGADFIENHAPPKGLKPEEIKAWVEETRDCALHVLRGRTDLDFAANLWNSLLDVLVEHKFDLTKCSNQIAEFAHDHWLNFTQLRRMLGRLLSLAKVLKINIAQNARVNKNVRNIFIEAHMSSLLMSTIDGKSMTDGNDHYIPFPIRLSHAQHDLDMLISSALPRISAANNFIVHKTTRGTQVNMFAVSVPIDEKYHESIALREFIRAVSAASMSPELMQSMLEALRDFLMENFHTPRMPTLNDFIPTYTPQYSGTTARKMIQKVVPDNCAICQEAILKNYDTIVLLKCNHHYHAHCFMALCEFSEKILCPLCRSAATVVAEGRIVEVAEKEKTYTLDDQLEAKSIIISEVGPSDRYTLNEEDERQMREKQAAEEAARAAKRRAEQAKQLDARRKAERERLRKERESQKKMAALTQRRR